MIKVDFVEGEHKYIQLYNKIKSMILDGELSYNEKMPTIRSLSKSLGINSVTVVKVYDLLESDGYIKKRVGSGSYVSLKKDGYNDLTSKDKEGYYRLDNANPSPQIFPIEDFKEAINMAMENEGANIFNYDDGHGIKELKEEMLKYLKKVKIHTDIENLIIISGAQQGIDIVSKALINYSDIVFIEEPTYSGAIEVLKSRGAKIVSIPMLNDGIDIGILKLKLEKLKPKILYTMPNFQNPTGITYSTYKKKKLLEMAEEYDFYILEDDFISDFKFAELDNRTLKSYDTNNRVIYIKSFSKILMPGLRVGLMDIPSELINRILMSKYSSDISTSMLIQKSLYYYMKSFNWQKHLRTVEKIYTDKYVECSHYIRKKLGRKFKIIENKGGINFFLELRRGYYSGDFYNYMKDKGVLLLTGSIYFDNDIDDRFFRINIASESIERIKEAVDLIEENVDNFYNLYKGKHEYINKNIVYY